MLSQVQGVNMHFVARGYQLDCRDAVLEDLKTYEKVCVVMPTGSGKTEVFGMIADEYLTNNPGKVVLILVHLALVCKQTQARLKYRLPNRRIGIVQGKNQPEFYHNIISGTMQTVRNMDKIDIFKDRVGLVIVDECHRLQSNSYNKIIESLPGVNVVGVTATPYKAGYLMTNYFDNISYTKKNDKIVMSLGHPNFQFLEWGRLKLALPRLGFGLG